MVSRKVRLWLALVLFVLSISLLAAAMWPAPRETQVVPLPTLSLPTPEAALPDSFACEVL